ncbi:hypothetical protein EKM02_02665 [Flavobacterium sp. RSP49]|uniref:DUF2846 domain-containing protein n=2 Tax=Flavobacterium TaxID=237 RepID=A0A432CSB2_9FLAO|nr:MULTISPECIES: hypothetical protein [Flavobacterium]RTY96257.1 hypothetical protein EKL32_02605 [Flavobacterium sp. GSN2]RTY70270.1 hypothetical protein EKL95_02655 [Flavobacterium sp. LB2P53]RTZ02432.1 hypothetical protein EKM02_02665 [Flavobacterium sp. RSP49]RTZ07925.1 hypothetical protein EKL98_00990 [Flavobacterium bomense]RTZ09062.1 hypothetical protein EKM03_00260 [Flavobacterium sp. GSP6]
MNQSTIVFRMSKSSGIYNKSNRYVVRIDSKTECEMNYSNNRKEYRVLPGKHTIEIGDGTSFQTEEIVLKAGETKVLSINPSLTYNLGFGILTGMVVTGLVIQFAVLQKFSPVMIIPFMLYLFIKKRDFKNSFAISYSK